MTEKTLKFTQARMEEEFSRIQAIYDYSKKITSENTRLFLTKARKVPDIRTTFRELLDQEQSTLFETQKDYVLDFKKMVAFDELADMITSIAKSLEDKIAAALAAKSTPTLVVPSPQGGQPTTTRSIKLPRPTLPIFDGKFENWTSFYQTFTKLIHENSELSNLEKVNYLFTHLDGAAKSICAGIPPTEENYVNIYDTLVKRFEDRRLLATHYFDKVINFRPLTQESEKDLNNFLNCFIEPAMALNELKLNNFFDFVMVYLAVKKLDRETCREFEHSFRDKDMPTFSDLEQFIRSQVKIVARQQKPVVGSQTKPNTVSSNNNATRKTHVFVAQSSDAKDQPSSKPSKLCVACKGGKPPHALYRCSVFKALSILERFSLVKRSKLCYNCFQNHYTRFCTSKGVCGVCSKKHHSLLHFHDVNVDEQHSESTVRPPTTLTMPSTAAESSSAVPIRSAALISSTPVSSMVLLSTAQVSVVDSKGQLHIIRALLDSGSQSHFITRECCQRLNLVTTPSSSIVDCLGNETVSSNEKVSFTFSSLKRPVVNFSIDASVLDEITNELPSIAISMESLPHLHGLELADSRFNVPGPIDLLISAALWPKIVGTRKKMGPVGSPTALSSKLGWIVIGETHLRPRSTSKSFLSVTDSSMETLLQRFWTIEELPSGNFISPDDEVCEKQFLETVRRQSDGRFIVSLPFKESTLLLGDSLQSSTQKFLSLERRFLRNPNLHQQYCRVMDGHETAGFVSCVAEVGGELPLAYYVPHHAVMKPGSSSTPLRVVWNMSAPTSTGYSLNDLLYVGPKLQANIFTILLNFRLFQVALSADVRQMYLQILVDPEDRKFQRFLWRSNPKEKLKVMQSNTVVFGMSSSPYLAQRVLRHLATIESYRFPLAARVTERDVYMDDVATSVPSEAVACVLYQELVDLFGAGCFTLAKWCSNSSVVMEKVPKELRLNEIRTFESDTGVSTKILGLCWDPLTDRFAFQLSALESVCTKRGILSTIAKIFDPLGLLSPLIIVAKILIKKLWCLGVDWDQEPPNDIRKEWDEFASNLSKLSTWSIPRHSGIFPAAHTCLIGFADASKSAYGAVVYIRTQVGESGPYEVQLLCAKSRVAPMKAFTIPRLELCASLLLSKLMKSVVTTYSDRHSFDSIYACTDSTVALQWLSSSPSRWKTFVANRVSQIQENLDVSCWRHVRGDTNPADCLSRGVSAQVLMDHPLWFSGPPWLVDEEHSWPLQAVSDLAESSPPEGIRKVALIATSSPEWPLAPLLERVSSLRLLHRSTAWVLRCSRISPVRTGNLQSSEIQLAERYWIIYIQKKHFSDILEVLKSPQPSKKKRHKIPLIQRLDLFVHDGILRVGGRLQNATLAYDHQHPVLLPKDDRYVELIVDQWHRDHLHTGAYLLASLLRTRYWILSARNLVRNRVHRCNLCFRNNPKPLRTKMASLPAARLQQAKAFTHCGVDYAGPFKIAMSRRRGGRSQKAYLCLFVCMSTKAVHLELASDLSTSCFLAAFKRFLSRRGPVSVMYSDQGSNFVGARSVFRELYSFIGSRDYSSTIEDELSQRSITWCLNPPSAPHFGGIWESNIKSGKTHLRKVVGDQILTYEEMATILTQIEALLNSRPLCPLGEDPRAPDALTPAHFLTFGSTLADLPARDFTDVPVQRLDHYERVDQIVQHYWRRWSQEYLHTLQQRMKWGEGDLPVAVGSIVLIKKESTPPLQWPLALVEAIYPSKDQQVRVARLRTATGSLTRPVVKLCLLPTQ